MGRALLRVGPGEGADAHVRVERLLGELPAGCTLNVAGPRQSEAPDAYALGLRMLELLFG